MSDVSGLAQNTSAAGTTKRKIIQIFIRKPKLRSPLSFHPPSKEGNNGLKKGPVTLLSFAAISSGVP
ncbi:MAG: hypothetical protein ABW189_02820 [Rickettsiales bacterium]